MRSLRWLLVPGLIACVVAVTVLWLGSSWLNSFVHSDAFRKEIEARAGRTLGGTVEIKEINYSIWSGITLSALATKLQTPQGTVVTQVERVTCSCSFLGLLRHRLELEGVNLINPEVVLTQQPAAIVATPRSRPGPAPENPNSTQGEGESTASLQVVIGSVKVTDGHLSIHDATGASKADLQGVRVGADTAGFYDGRAVTGKLRIATVALPQNLSLADFSTPFTWSAGTINAGPFDATAFGGRMTGNYKLDPAGPSVLEVSATGIDVSKIGQTATPGSASNLSGSLALQSHWHGVETGKLTGEGDAQITGGKLRGVGALHDLAFALHVGSLADPNLKSVDVRFQVANGITHFNDLHIDSDDFEMTGDGVIDAQGRLSANMVLTLHGGAMGGIPGAAASLFSMLPGGAGSFPFHISGTASNPHADISSILFMPGTKVERTLNKTISHFFQ